MPIDTLEKIVSILSQALIYLGIITALVGAAQYHFSQRLEAAKELQYQKKIERLRDDQAKIKTFKGKLQMRFSGSWKELPFPPQVITSVDHEFYAILLGPNMKQIKLYAAKHPDFHQLTEGEIQFKASQVAEEEDFEGLFVEELGKYKFIQFYVPFILHRNFLTKEILVSEIELELFVNGERFKLDFNVELPRRFEVKIFYDDKSIAWGAAKLPIGKIYHSV